MKLTPDAITKLDQLIQTAMIAGLKKLVIEPDKVRGIDEKQSVVIINTAKARIPDLNGKQIGINRIDQLSARINFVKNQGDLVIEATESTSNPADIALLELSATGKTSTRSRVQFRGASVEAVKGVPKNINDTLVWELKILVADLPLISQALAAMGAEQLTFASRDGKAVSVEFVDATKDITTIELDSQATWIGTGTAGTSFCQKYPAKTLLALLKEAAKTGDVTVKLGEGGILTLEINGNVVYVIPAV